jgi:hypothetical protein
MSFFEYLFCRLYWWNTQIIKEKDVPSVYSIFGLSIFQGFSIIPVYDIMYRYLFKSFYIKDIFGINSYLIIGLIVLLIDFAYFRKSRYEILLKKFQKLLPVEKRKKDILCIIYILTIIVVNVLLTIYFRAHNV